MDGVPPSHPPSRRLGGVYELSPEPASIREATFLPGSGARVCMCPHSPDTCGSLSSRQLGSVLCLSPAAAPLSPPMGIQLWSFFCCQPRWLQRSLPHPLAKARLCPCFPLCHCVLKNPPKGVRVLMARNEHLIVIWKDSLPQASRLFPGIGAHDLYVHFTRSSGYGESQSSGGSTLGEKLTPMTLYLCSPVRHSTAVLPLEASVLALGWMKTPAEVVSPGCPSPRSPRDESRAVVGGASPPRFTCALRALPRAGNGMI